MLAGCHRFAALCRVVLPLAAAGGPADSALS